MKSLKPLCETVHLTAMGVWLGALLMTGAAAAVIFPTMKKLGPVIPSYEKYTGEHWLIVAGLPASKFFDVCDAAQFTCSILAAGSLMLLVFRAKVGFLRRSMMIRTAALVIAMFLLGCLLFFVAPTMNTNLKLYWIAAAEGNNAAAEQFHAAFDADHPTARRLLSSTAVFVFISLIAGAWAATTHSLATTSPARPRRSGPGSADADAPRKPASAKLETPLLARTPPR